MENDYIEMMKVNGWKVFKREAFLGRPSEYCYCTDGTRIAYVQWSDWRPQVSTVHYANKQTGTGFQFADTITPETIRQAMNCIAPSWASAKDRASVLKYKNWEEFHKSNSFNAKLTEV